MKKLCCALFLLLSLCSCSYGFSAVGGNGGIMAGAGTSLAF